MSSPSRIKSLDSSNSNSSAGKRQISAEIADVTLTKKIDLGKTTDEKQKKIQTMLTSPGHSFILALSDKVDEDKKAYDCVLCYQNSHRTNLQEIIQHCKSKEHLLKVMELVNPEYADFYSKKGTSFEIAAVLKGKMDYIDKDGVLFAHLVTFLSVRKRMKDRIVKLRKELANISVMSKKDFTKSIPSKKATPVQSPKGSYPYSASETAGKLIGVSSRTEKIVLKEQKVIINKSNYLSKSLPLINQKPDTSNSKSKDETIATKSSVQMKPERATSNVSKIDVKTEDKSEKQKPQSLRKNLVSVKPESVKESATMKLTCEKTPTEKKQPQIGKFVQKISDNSQEQMQALKFQPTSKTLSLPISESKTPCSKAAVKISASKSETDKPNETKEEKQKRENIVLHEDNLKNEDSNDDNNLDPKKKNIKMSSPSRIKSLDSSNSNSSAGKRQISAVIADVTLTKKIDLGKTTDEKQKKIQTMLTSPGHSFILVLSDKVDEDKKAYDCVLCYQNSHRTNLQEMIQHCKSKEHLLKVMELVNPEYAAFYSKKGTSYEIAAVLKSKTGDLDKDGILFAPLSTFLSVRKNINYRIAKLRKNQKNTPAKAKEDWAKAISSKNLTQVQSPKGSFPFSSSVKKHNNNVCATDVKDSSVTEDKKSQVVLLKRRNSDSDKTSLPNPAKKICIPAKKIDFATRSEANKETGIKNLKKSDKSSESEKDWQKTENAEDNSKNEVPNDNGTLDLKQYSDKLEKEVYENYKEEINELVELQRNRRPNKVIIVTDLRDVFTEDEVQSSNYQYKIFKGMNLAFDNLNKYLIQNQDFGKGVLYVILCGINSIYREKINPECLKTRCITPCKFLDTTNYDIDLIKKAIHVHKLILKLSKNDAAIFSALLPSSPKDFNNFSYQQRKCSKIHEAPLPPQCLELFDKNKLCLYNAFTKLHSKLLGFTPLDLEKGFEQHSNNPTLYFSFTANGYHFTDTFASDRKSALLKQCDLLMKRLSQSLNLGEDDTGNKPDEGVKKVSESSKLLETNSSMSELNYESKVESPEATNSDGKSSRSGLRVHKIENYVEKTICEMDLTREKNILSVEVKDSSPNFKENENVESLATKEIIDKDESLEDALQQAENEEAPNIKNSTELKDSPDTDNQDCPNIDNQIQNEKSIPARDPSLQQSQENIEIDVSKEKISDINDSENVIDQSGCSTYDPFNPTSPNPESDVTDTETDCNEKVVDHYKTSAKSMEDRSSESEIQADFKNKEACDDIIILESNKSNKIVPYVLLSDSETDEEQGKINTDFGRKTNALKEEKANVTLSCYNHIYVIGHINPLSKKNRNLLNYTFIEKALSDLDEESADNLLNKKFPIVANSVCICTCSILDICETVIKSKLLTSVHRRRFFILYDLKDSSSEQSSSEATAEGRMFISKMVTSFIKIVNKLRERLPVIVMPLEPFALIAKLKCPFHENKADALTIFVRGSPDKWNDYRDVFVHDWNRILDTNDEKINKMSCWNSFVNVPSIIYPVGRDDLDDKTIVKQRSLWGQNVNETLRRLHKKKLQQSFNNASTKPIRSISYQSSAAGQKTKYKESVSDYEEYIIEVANITDSIPHKFFTEMCSVAAEKEVFCKFIKGSVYITFDSCSIGSFFLDYFDNLAIGDTVLKTSLCKKECKLPNFQIENSTSISLQNRLLPYLEKWKYKILLVVKKNLRHTLSCESFKTIKCYKSDCDESRCIFYHSEIDRRRNPFSIPYKSMACRISSGSVCLYGDNCQFAHNRYESIFHPFNLYSKICMDYKTRNKCFVKNQLCALAHQDSPETFFTKYWKDSLVLGTSLCVEFLAGAIRKVHFYGTFFKDCRIFVIGASDEFLDNTWVAVKDICNKHYSYIYNFAGEKVFGREPLLFGKPSKFVGIIDRLALVPFTLIIVSQIDVILGIESERRALVEFFSRSKMFAHPDVQSLFVADQYDSRLPVKIKVNLGKEVKVIQNPGHNVTFPYDVPYTPIRTPPTWLAKALNQLQEEEVKKEKSELCLWFRKGNVDSLDPSENDDFEDLSSEEERNSGRRGIKRKPSRSYRSRSSSYHKSRSKSPVHKRHRSRSRSRSRRSSRKRRSSSRYSLKRPAKRCRSRQSYSPPTSSNNSFRRSSSSSISPDRTPFMEKKDKDDAENIKILSPSRCEEQEKKSEFSMERIVHQSILLELATQMFNNTSLLEELGDDLFEEFEAERKEICFKLEEDFEDYKTMPYLYEKYEDCYEGFMQVYKIKYQNQSKEHQEMMWKEYWKSNFDFIEKMELQKRMMSLRKKFREKLESLPPPPPPPPVISVQDTRLGLNKSEINISLSSQGYSSVIKSDSTSQPTNDIGSCSNETYSSSSNLVTPNLYSLSTEENLDRQIASINTPLLTDDKIVPGLDQHHSVTENQNILPPENSEEALIVHNNSCQTNTDSSVDSSKKQIPPLDGVHSTLLPISKESSPSNIDDSKSETPLPDNVHSPMPEISMETSSLHIKDLSNKDVTANKSAFQSAIDSFDDGINRETPPSKRDHCLVPTIPLESSLANIETLSKEDVTVIESSFPTAIDPSNDDSKRETSPADQGVHSPLNLTSVKYSPTHIKALTKDPSSDLENECLDEALVSQSVSNNLVSSENMTIIDKQAESFPLVTPTMILTHTEENEEKITINESNTSEVSESESSLQNFSMDKAIADLELMVPDIGDLGSSLNTIISFSKEEGIDSEKSLRNFANPDNVTLMERALTKIKCLESWKDLYSSLERSVNSLIKYTRKEVEKKEKNDLALDCERIAKDTIGKDPSLILEMIRTTAAKEGVKLTKHQESEIYIKVCFIHFNLVSSKE